MIAPERPWNEFVPEIVASTAETDRPVLIVGEPGTGKDLLARLIHAGSKRRGGPFVKATCRADAREKIDAELFGHGAGANREVGHRRLGSVDFAHTGVMFVKGAHDLPQSARDSLCRLVETRAFSRIGSDHRVVIDVRLIAGAARPLDAVPGGVAWRDRLLDLGLLEIRVPPLRDRKEEIPILAESFLAEFAAWYGRRVVLSSETMSLFSEYAWPGNVGELRKIVRGLVVNGGPQQIHDEIRERQGST